MATIEKMNVYVITENKVTLQTKDGKWFHQLFLPTISQNKPLQNKVTVDMYWKSIRDVLFGKNKKTKLKITKKKDIKFIAFPCKNNTVIAFVTGNDKSDALKDIYKLTIKEDKTVTAAKNNKQPNEVSNNDKPGSKLFELIKKELKQFGEVKKVDKIKLDDKSTRINIQIVTKRTEEQMWDAVNTVIKPIFSDKFDVEVEETSDMTYGNTILCPVLLSIKSENKKVAKETKTLPKEEALYCAEINNIRWDTYDEESNTEGDPAELELPKGVSIYNIEADGIEDAKDQIAELLSDNYGWLVNGFDIDDLKIQTENNHKDFENETFYDAPVMASVENKSESLAEVEHDFITGLINYEDAVNTILDMGEADSESDAQAIVDAWELKNKKDIGKVEAHDFTIYLYNVKEPEEELKKLEHHFDWLYGDTNSGDYWGVNVSDKTDGNVVIKGKVSGVSEKDFKANIEEGLESYNAELDDIVWNEK